MKALIPLEFYKKLTPSALLNILKTYIQQERYEDIKIALEVNQNNLNILHIAIEYLNLNVIKDILISTKKGEMDLNTSIDKAIEYTSGMENMNLARVCHQLN